MDASTATAHSFSFFEKFLTLKMSRLIDIYSSPQVILTFSLAFHQGYFCAGYVISVENPSGGPSKEKP